MPDAGVSASKRLESRIMSGQVWRRQCACDEEAVHEADLHASEEGRHPDPVCWQVRQESSH